MPWRAKRKSNASLGSNIFMREIGKLYRLEGQLVRDGRGLCLRRESDGALWKLAMADDVPELLDRYVGVEGFKSAPETLDVCWIAKLPEGRMHGNQAASL